MKGLNYITCPDAMSDVSVDVSKSDSSDAEPQAKNIDEISHLDSDHLKIIDHNLESESTEIIQEPEKKKKSKKAQYEYKQLAFPSVAVNDSDFASDEGDQSILRSETKDIKHAQKLTKSEAASDNNKIENQDFSSKSKDKYSKVEEPSSTRAKREHSDSIKLEADKEDQQQSEQKESKPSKTTSEPKGVEIENNNKNDIDSSDSGSVSISVSKSSSSSNSFIEKEKENNDNNDKGESEHSTPDINQKDQNKNNQNTKDSNPKVAEGYIINHEENNSPDERLLEEGAHESSDEPIVLEPEKTRAQIVAELSDAVSKGETQSSCCILL